MSRRFRRRLLLAIVALSAFGVTTVIYAPGWIWSRSNSDASFVVKPYVQLGDAPASPAAPAAHLELLWQGYDRDDSWAVEVQPAPGKPWAKAAAPAMKRVTVRDVLARRLYRTTLSDLVPGQECAYRVRLGGEVVFEARARTPRPPGVAHRFVAFGDGGAGSWPQAAVAYQAWRTAPDLVLITGDIAYMRGRISDYDANFFPAYNNDTSSAWWGAPLMRSIPFFAAPGNHDMVFRNLNDVPDALGYFLFWSQPLNGPQLDAQSDRWPGLEGASDRQQAFRQAAGAAYPRMANFSFDYGDVHWTILDANPPYTDFTAPALRDWLAADLAAAQAAAWRFVAFHHPPFHSSTEHATDQRTRLLVDLLEQGNVDLVFTGHVHNYQRSYPLRFVAGNNPGAGSIVSGQWELDREYDGVTRTRPRGIIYLVTGAGGAKLYQTFALQPYTVKYDTNAHSFTVVDVEPKRLRVRQVSDRGKELDRFDVTK